LDLNAQQAFFVGLQQSRLLTAPQLRSVRRAAADGARTAQIVRALTRQQWLTPWQTQQLSAGHTGFRFGAYTLLDFLGRGRMGVVYQARQAKTQQIVAIKVMSVAAARDRRLAARFLREIRLVSTLQSPHVVSALDAGRVGERYFLATEFLPGRNLQEWIKRERRLPIGWVCECARQTAVGLQHIHERGLVHRDLKPSNLMVTADSLDVIPRVCILDLGLGRMIEGRDEAGDITTAGHTVGTLDYMAPEQLENGHAADIRSDIYSLGCSVFETLTGRLPYDGSDVGAKLLAKLTTDAPLVGAFRTDVPRELAILISRLICRDRDKRPANPAEVVEAFEPFSVVSRCKSAPLVEVSGKTPALFVDVEMGQRTSADAAVAGRQIQPTGSQEHRPAWLAQFWSSFPARLVSKWTSRQGHGALREKHKSPHARAGRDDRETGV
jgi:serine/threonine-protein kinase